MLELIAQYEISTQDQLIEKLRESGCEATQATVSRDIRALRIQKVSDARGVVRYVAAREETASRIGSGFAASVIGVDFACNIVVVRTYAGMAQAVAIGIEGLRMSQVLGCVAGDDTIMIVAKNEDQAIEITERLRGLRETV